MADPSTKPETSEAVERLPDTLPGHWTTAQGRKMAIATLNDRHMDHNRERISDFALANEVFLSPGIANLTDAKERIRWLSARLAVAEAALATPAVSVPVGEVERLSRAIDPGAWADELPGMTRAAVEGFHLRRQQANEAALRVIAASPSVAIGAGEVDRLRTDIAGIRGNFERIAAREPNDQPAYKDGVRPWGTGDLRHVIKTLAAAEAALAPASASIPADVEREALEACLRFIEYFRDNGVELIGEGVHAGLRKGTSAIDSASLYRAIADSRTSAWSDAVAFAHDPFFSMWGGDDAIRQAKAALAARPSTVERG